MALWGNSDNVTSAGTVGLNYSTGVVTGSSTKFGDAGSAQVGDCLLYTSPSPRDVEESRMPSSA